MSQLDRGETSRIMYIENKSSGLSGPARIGRVTFSKSGKTVYCEEYWTAVRGLPQRIGERST